MRRLSITLSVVMVLPAVNLGAQTIRGQVVDSISQAPVDRGFVVVVDENGQETIRVLTTTQGRFTVQVGGPGHYRLRSERIGFRVWESDLLRFEAGQTYDINPMISALPRQLATINVSGETQCEERKGPDTGLLWEEARKALVAASWSAAQALHVHRAHRYERVLNRGRDLVDEQIRVPVLSSALPFVSVDPVKLANEGYILPDTASGDWEWWAPDANVILDDSFHETHCFWAVRGEGERTGLIGLAFEPTPQRELADVAGTLWLDELSAELRFVEFVYRNHPLRVDERHSGGRAEFVQLQTGAWILDRWRIIIPQVRGSARRPRIVGYQEAGGEVIESYTPEGELVYENRALAILRGTVYDSTINAPADGDVVTVIDSEYTVETDDAGSFEIRTLLHGKYTIMSRRMEWLGYTRGRIEHEFVAGDNVEIDMVIPRLRTIHERLCRSAPPDSNRMLHGEVRDPDGAPLEDAEVVIEWEPGIQRKTKSGEDGRYVLCDLPDDTPMTLAVQHRFFEADPVSVQFVGRDFLVGDGQDRSSFYAPDRIVRLGIETKRLQSLR